MSYKECACTVFREVVNTNSMCSGRNEISKAIPDISSKVLTDILKSLKSDKLIYRHYYVEIPTPVEYSLTPLGLSLIPKLHELIGWAIENFKNFKLQK